MTTFEIQTLNKNQLTDAFKKYPDNFKKYFSQAINASLAFLSKTAANDSIMQFKTPRSQRTGMLQLSFDLGLKRASVDSLIGAIGPTVKYAIMVHEGTVAHDIPNAWGRRNVTAHHPGTAPNRFMPRIIKAAQGDINNVFSQALELTIRGIKL